MFSHQQSELLAFGPNVRLGAHPRDKIILFGSRSNWLDDPPNNVFKPQFIVKKVKYGGTSIMIWRYFSYYGIGSIYCMIMDQYEYMRMDVESWQLLSLTYLTGKQTSCHDCTSR